MRDLTHHVFRVAFDFIFFFSFVCVFGLICLHLGLLLNNRRFEGFEQSPLLTEFMLSALRVGSKILTGI